MGKLTKYTHDIAKNDILCLVTHTAQGKATKLEVVLKASDLLAANTHWGVSTVCQLASQLLGFQVTV
jgi:hypothetical protein